MLRMCVCAFSLRRESPDQSWGDEPLISEVVLSHATSPSNGTMTTPLHTQLVQWPAPPALALLVCTIIVPPLLVHMATVLPSCLCHCSHSSSRSHQPRCPCMLPPLHLRHPHACLLHRLRHPRMRSMPVLRHLLSPTLDPAMSTLDPVVTVMNLSLNTTNAIAPAELMDLALLKGKLMGRCLTIAC
jgi:hypothetical protein